MQRPCVLACVVVVGILPLAACGTGGASDVTRRRITRVSEAARDGTVRSDGEVTTGRHVVAGDQHPAGVGDLLTGEEVRLFFSFETSELPADATIVEAVLRFRQVFQLNSLLTLNPLLIESLAYDTLDAGDYTSSPLETPTPVTLNGLNIVREIDVTLLVQADVDEGRTRSQFRLRMQGGTNADTLADFVALETGDNDHGTGNRPELLIEFEVPAGP